ncbi:phage head spike fiber domain-containing protein [Xanthobacter aminoxidans]|uniref:DUF2793 domain-containing protein n=1 Tax=Xanthobacter aminoxidans TaxID=186280 RepID=A0ABW6ZC93_9HYPH
MDFANYYGTGTISVSANGTAVTGVGTLWSALVMPGDTLEAGGRAVRVLSVTDDSHLTLAYGWPSTALAGSGYMIVYNSPDRATGTYVAERVRELIERQRVLDDAVATYAAVSVGLDTPPGSPLESDLYVVGTSPTGAWVGYAGYLAIWSGIAWRFTPPAQGMQVVALDTDMMWRRTAAGWSMWALGDRLALNGRTPMLVADFVRDQYRLNGSGVAASDLFTRSGGTKRVIGASGLLETVAANVLAIDYSTGRRRLLNEGSTTNQVVNSSTPTTWSKPGTTTITANAAVAPDGTTTAARIQATEWTAIPTSGVAASTLYTNSIWIKSATGANQNVPLTVNDDGPPFTVVASKTVAITPQWQRVTITGTALATTSNYRLVLGAGDYHVWQPQTEKGPVATSLIPTSGSPASRVADVVTWTAAAVAVLNTGTTTIAWRGMLSGATETWTLMLTANANALWMMAYRADSTSAWFTAPGAPSSGISVSPVPLGKIAICGCWDSAGWRMSANGSAPVSAAGSGAGVISSVNFGGAGGPSPGTAQYIDEIDVWSIAGSAAAVQVQARDWD